MSHTYFASISAPHTDADKFGFRITVGTFESDLKASVALCRMVSAGGAHFNMDVNCFWRATVDANGSHKNTALVTSASAQ